MQITVRLTFTDDKYVKERTVGFDCFGIQGNVIHDNKNRVKRKYIGEEKLLQINRFKISQLLFLD